LKIDQGLPDKLSRLTSSFAIRASAARMQAGHQSKSPFVSPIGKLLSEAGHFDLKAVDDVFLQQVHKARDMAQRARNAKNTPPNET